ncbi:MAG: NUDIX domain-containing protein [Akkermansiaceae bacterium]
MKEFETINSRVAYKNKWMTVREDKVLRPSGAEGIYGVVDKPDFVAIIPIHQGCIHLVEQYRYPVEGRYWEIPQGSWEESPESDNSIVAAGELEEETGLKAGKMKYIGHIFQAYGYSNQGFHLYFATELKKSEQSLDAEEEGLITQCFDLTEFEKMITSGVVKDATTISAYGYAKLKGLV